MYRVENGEFEYLYMYTYGFLSKSITRQQILGSVLVLTAKDSLNISERSGTEHKEFPGHQATFRLLKGEISHATTP